MKNLISRVPGFLVLVFGITMLSFLLTYLSPGDPAEMILRKKGGMVTQEQIEKKRQELGLQDGVIQQYGHWVINAARGDLGTSYKSNRPVTEDFKRTLPATMELAFLALLFTVLLSTPLGILCALRKDGIIDYVVRGLTCIFSSMPSFFLALVLLYTCSLTLGWFPVIAKGQPHGVVLPALTMALTLSAWYTRQVRALLLKEMQKGYVVGLRSRGISMTRVMVFHVFKNMLYPILTLLGMSVGSLLGGATIVESIFTWPGVGKLAVDAISYRDYPVIQGYVLWMALIYCAVHAFVELCGVLLDGKRKQLTDLQET
ncbi:peptide/nickel transport system permease protein [Lachnospiraceae bacterium XBB1006]|nr:peptide/nickel transport system permease protein [Lachnospiraceae bacterium XBB1006]